MSRPSSRGEPRHPAYGELHPVTPYAAVLLARNPSPMTLEGTNSWVLHAPGTPSCVVVDPGPDDEAHLRGLAAAGRVELIVVTHHHADHTAGVDRLHELTGAPVLAVDPAYRRGAHAASALADSTQISAGGVAMTVFATPGHTADSVSLLVGAADGDDAILTGDTVLGRGSTMIAAPDGDLGAHLDSLRRIRAVGGRLLPGHGPDRPDARAVVTAYLAHRMDRLDQVGTALRRRDAFAGEVEAADIVPEVYADTDPVLWPAAEQSVAAMLEYLRAGAAQATQQAAGTSRASVERDGRQ
ncbi:MAG: MBL fold metallo-hydrolase [Mycobacteriales bacterium]